jgi:hypothetical protein
MAIGAVSGRPHNLLINMHKNNYQWKYLFTVD